jgi:hypothetical protein
MHPVTAWYLAEAKHDDMMRALARPRLPRPERRERHGLSAWVDARLHRRTASRALPATPAGCGLPMGCAA